MAKEGKSIRWIVTVSMIFMAYLAWGFLAGSYAGSSGGAVLVTGGRRSGAILLFLSGIYSFIATSITQIPNFFSVILWHLQNRIWLPILFVFLELGILGGGVALQKLEDNLSAPQRRRREAERPVSAAGKSSSSKVAKRKKKKRRPPGA